MNTSNNRCVSSHGLSAFYVPDAGLRAVHTCFLLMLSRIPCYWRHCLQFLEEDMETERLSDLPEIPWL